MCSEHTAIHYSRRELDLVSFEFLKIIKFSFSESRVFCVLFSSFLSDFVVRKKPFPKKFIGNSRETLSCILIFSHWENVLQIHWILTMNLSQHVLIRLIIPIWCCCHPVKMIFKIDFFYFHRFLCNDFAPKFAAQCSSFSPLLILSCRPSLHWSQLTQSTSHDKHSILCVQFFLLRRHQRQQQQQQLKISNKRYFDRHFRTLQRMATHCVSSVCFVRWFVCCRVCYYFAVAFDWFAFALSTLCVQRSCVSFGITCNDKRE